MMKQSFNDDRGLPVWYDDEDYEVVKGVIVRKKNDYSANIETKVINEEPEESEHNGKTVVARKKIVSLRLKKNTQQQGEE